MGTNTLTDTIKVNATQINGQQIESSGKGSIFWIQGDKNTSCSGVQPPHLARTTDLAFVSTKEQLTDALNRQIGILIVLDSVLPEQNTVPKNLLLFKTNHISRAMSLILPLFDKKKSRFKWDEDIHPSAVIHHSAKIGSQAKIGPFVSIAENVVLGDRTVIGANSVIESQAQVGSDCIIHSQVFIGANCEVGNHCEIHPQTTIGSDGFGYATDDKFKHHKIPQLGKVVIEDNVEIGANCAIDRATLTETRIRTGTKFDNLCHVAHNCDIGSDGLYAAGFFVAGSSQIGSKFMCGGNVVVTSHVKLTDRVILSGRSTVTNHIPEPGQYGGYPLQPLKEALKTIANIGHLTEMRKQIQKILKHLQLNDKN